MEKNRYVFTECSIFSNNHPSHNVNLRSISIHYFIIDYNNFQSSALAEILEYSRKRRVHIYTAITELYQPHPQQLYHDDSYETDKDLNCNCNTIILSRTKSFSF